MRLAHAVFPIPLPSSYSAGDVEALSPMNLVVDWEASGILCRTWRLSVDNAWLKTTKMTDFDRCGLLFHLSYLLWT